MKSAYEYTHNDIRIPSVLAESLMRWVESASPPGGFLSAVICNDLVGAIGRADNESLKALPAIVFWLYNHAPAECWGSSARVANWERLHRERRLQEAS